MGIEKVKWVSSPFFRHSALADARCRSAVGFSGVAFLVASRVMLTGRTLSATQVYQPQNFIAWGAYLPLSLYEYYTAPLSPVLWPLLIPDPLHSSLPPSFHSRADALRSRHNGRPGCLAHNSIASDASQTLLPWSEMRRVVTDCS